MIDALGVGLWSHHMLHGSRAVSPDLFSRAIGLIVEGVVARAGAGPGWRSHMKAPDRPRPRFARMYVRSAANAEERERQTTDDACSMACAELSSRSAPGTGSTSALPAGGERGHRDRAGADVAKPS